MEKATGRESITLSAVGASIEICKLELMEEGLNPEGTKRTEERRCSLGAGLGSPTLQRKKNQQPLIRARHFCKKHAGLFKKVLVHLLCLAYAAYFLAACVLDFRRALALFILTCLALFILAHRLLKRLLGSKLTRCLKLLENLHLTLWLKWVFAGFSLIRIILWLALDTAQRPEHLTAFSEICVFIILLFACSRHHSAVFLNYTVAGSSFVFGEMLVKHVFAFQVLPVILFFGCVISVLYYLGLVQWVLQKVTIGTTATETLAVAGGIFVGMTEAPLLIHPYLGDMTLSEIHAVMTGGFATISGTMLGAYISFGISPASLISASVMATPCALALSKLVYPEVEESKFKSEDGVKLPYGNEKNILEAVSNGATGAIGLVTNVAANLIAFLAMLAFINAALTRLGELVEIQGLSFQVICSDLLRPMVFMMGVQWADCAIVAEMMGTKVFINEFVAYQQLSLYRHKRLSGVEEWIGASVAPRWKSDLSQTVVRAFLTGACTPCINACVAGLLYVPWGVGADCGSFLNTAFTNSSYETYMCCKELFQSTSLNGTHGPSFSGPREGSEFGAVALANCCGISNHFTCV